MTLDDSGIRGVQAKIQAGLERRKAGLVALAKAHLAEMLAEFHANQPSGQGVSGDYWNNITSEAANAVFGEAFSTDEAVGFFIAHGMEYGIYLELANNRQNESLRPLIEVYGAKYIASARRIMG